MCDICAVEFMDCVTLTECHLVSQKNEDVDGWVTELANTIDSGIDIGYF